jgi:uncharacterized protein YegP (UPF0339 family)
MKTFNELRESSKDVLLKRYHKYKDKQMSPAEAQQFRQLVRKLKAMGVSLKEETVEEKFKVSYKDNGSYSVVFRNKNGKVESEVRADSKEKAEKQAALRNKRVKPSEGAWEVVRTNESVEESTQAYGKSQEKIRDKKKKDAISSSDKEKLAKLKKMMSKEDLDESLRKSIAQNSGKFPEGSKVYCKKHKSKGKVLTVGKDFVKVGLDNGKDVDCKPSDLVKESVSLKENFAIYKNGKPLKIKGKEVTSRSKESAQKAIDTMQKQPFNKDAKFTIVQTKTNAPKDTGAYKRYTMQRKSIPAWRYAERGE